MKQNLLFLTISLVITLFISSCSSDDANNNVKATIAGEWKTAERIFMSDKDTDYDKQINDAFREDLKVRTLTKDFPLKSQIVLPPDTIQGTFSFVARLINTQVIERTTEGTYKLIRDSIFINEQDSKLSYGAKVRFNSNTMITYQKVTIKELSIYLAQTKFLDPNVLPRDIEGTLMTRDVR